MSESEKKADALIEQRGHTLILTLNRPEARNALSTEMLSIMVEAWDRVDNDPDIRCCILTGAGGYFCAGMDLKAATAKPPGDSFKDGSYDPSRIDALLKGRRLTKPLIAAVEGPAIAGGTELALACDLIVAAEDAKFGIPEVKRGLAAAAGGLLRLPQRIPPNVAMEYALTGDFFSAADAQRFGLANRVTAPGRALDGAIELAERITANAPLSIAATKEVIIKSADWTAEDMWANQEAIIRPVFGSADAREGASAFAEKRAPVWRGE